MTLIACSWSLSAQTRTYHGTVVDGANNEPLIGATIMPIGGGQGVATDADGKFSLNVPANVRQVRITYVGYNSQTVTLKSNMVIHLTSTSSNLDDVVVVAYGTANKESLTGSVAVVGSKEIEDRPVTSVTAALEGNAPGVQVNNSTGYPGSQPTIRIRGFNSINGSNTPLYVVDGIVYDGDIAALNPADIESMSVLKDAASSALYGNRGANGVILITTKKAKNVGKVDVTLQVRQGMYNRGLPYYDRLEANQWMESALLGWANGRYSAAPGSYVDAADALAKVRGQFVTSYLKGNNIYDKSGEDLFSPEGKLLGQQLPGYTDLDWWDAISQNGHRQEYNVNASAATEKFNISSSIGYLKENGYVIKTDYERFSGRLNANYQPVSFFKTGVNLNASYVNSEVGGADPDALNLVTNPFLTMFNCPVQPYYVHDSDGSIMLDEKGQPIWNTSGLNKGDNIAWTMRLNETRFSSLQADASVYGTFIIPYGFELTVRGQMWRNKQRDVDYSNNVVGSQEGTGGLDNTWYNFGSHTFMQTLTWSQDYGKNHIDVLLDHENYQYGYDYEFLRKSQQLLPDMIHISNFSTMDYSSESKVKIRTESYLGRVRYNWDQKYFAEASIRRDGTSRFSKDNRWGTFWSVGASWVISKEKFMRSLTWVDFLKLRAAYGSVGNDASASAYAYWGLYGFRTYNKENVLSPVNLATPDIKWEATKTFDIALEGSLFNDRFNFSIGYFDKRNSDLLFNLTTPWSSGMLDNTGVNASILKNIGTMTNRGWELQFGVDIIRNHDIKWNFSVDATFLKNKILKLPDGKNIVGDALFQGKSLYEHYNYSWAGVDLLTGQSLYEMVPDSPDYYKYDENNQPYYDEQAYLTKLAQAKAAGAYVEIDGKGYTTRSNYAGRKICGTALPTVYGSFGTNFSWKGINLGLLFTYSLGGKTYDGNYQTLMSTSNDNPGALHKDILNSWTAAPEGLTEHVIDPNGVPVNDTNLSGYNNLTSSRWLTSSNYLVFKNLSLSYDFPTKWVSAMKMQNLNLGMSIDNLFIASARKGMNPQYGFGGGQGAYYMPSRVFSFQLSVKF